MRVKSGPTNVRQMPFRPLTFRSILSTAGVILTHSSSQQMFSSAVITSAEQRANTLYNLDQVQSIDFWVAWTGRRSGVRSERSPFNRNNAPGGNTTDLLKGRAVQQVGDGQQQGGVDGAEVVLQSIALVHFICLGKVEMREFSVRVWNLKNSNHKVARSTIFGGLIAILTTQNIPCRIPILYDRGVKYIHTKI